MGRKRKKKARQGEQAAKPVLTHPGMEVVEPTPEFAAKHPLEKVKTDQGSHTKRVRSRRPIDDYHRMYCIDRDRGIGEQYRRGINEDQFRAADRLSCNYERTFHRLSMPLDGIRVESSINLCDMGEERIHDGARRFAGIISFYFGQRAMSKLRK